MLVCAIDCLNAKNHGLNQISISGLGTTYYLPNVCKYTDSPALYSSCKAAILFKFRQYLNHKATLRIYKYL